MFGLMLIILGVWTNVMRVGLSVAARLILRDLSRVLNVPWCMVMLSSFSDFRLGVVLSILCVSSISFV